MICPAPALIAAAVWCWQHPDVVQGVALMAVSLYGLAAIATSDLMCPESYGRHNR